MKNIRINAIAVLALALSGGSLLLSATPASQALSDKDVFVTNTTANPLPVAVQGTAAVTGNVNVANSPTVKVDSSTPLAVRIVEEPYDVRVEVSNWGDSVSKCKLVPIPDGMRLELETVVVDAS